MIKRRNVLFFFFLMWRVCFNEKCVVKQLTMETSFMFRVSRRLGEQAGCRGFPSSHRCPRRRPGSSRARGWLRCQLQGVQGPSPGPALCSSCVLAPSRCPECGHCCAPQEQRVLWWGGEEFPSGDIRTRGCCGNTGSCSSHCALPACGVRALIPEIVQHFWIFI